jgi:hypothetical protein
MTLFEENDSSGLLDDQKPMVSAINEKAKEEAKEAIKRQEAENIIKMSLKAGIPKELIGWNHDLFNTWWQKSNNSGMYGRDKGPRPSEMSAELYDLKSDWPRKNLVIIVEGGTSDVRKGLANLILARSIMGNFCHPGRLGVTVPYSMISLKFNSFDSDRQAFVSKLLEIPAILLSEIPQNSGFRSSSDGAAMMDQLLDMHVGPVIMSLATVSASFEGSTTYGNAFRDIIDAAKQSAKTNKLWKFSLKTTTLQDPISFKKELSKDK